MKRVLRGSRNLRLWIALSLLALSPSGARAQSCQTSAELDAAARTAVTSAAQRYFDMAVRGDSASIRQNSIPSLAADFADIETAIKDNQPNLAGGQSTMKASFLLDATGTATIPNAEFYCGVFGKNGQTANSAAFYLNNLPPGKYAVVLLDVNSAKGRNMFSEVLQQTGIDWKVAGLHIKPALIAGHDSDWFLTQARQYKAKGQLHNAWMYYFQAIDLVGRGLVFMSTLATDKLYDEAQGVQPNDLPVNGRTVDLPAGSTTFKLTAVRPLRIGDDLDLFVEYQVADASNPNQNFQNNVAVMKALLAKYPEFGDAFAGVDVLVSDPSKRNYATLLAMKDIK